MAVAERKGSLVRVLEFYQEQGANNNKIEIDVSPNGQVRNHIRENPEKGKTKFEANQ